MLHRFTKYDSTNDEPQSFGFNNNWLAVKNSKLDDICSSLQLKYPKPASWNAGLSKCNVRFPGKLVFITPQLNNWTLILNFSVYRGGNTKRYIEEISASMNTEIACFGNLPSVNFVMWALAHKGEAERIYSHSDGVTHIDVGERLSEEKDLNLKFSTDEADGDGEYDLMPTAKSVFYIAESRSINPLKISDNFKEPSAGFIAKRST